MAGKVSTLDYTRLAEMIVLQGLTQAKAAKELGLVKSSISMAMKRPQFLRAAADIAQVQEERVIQDVPLASVHRRMKRLEFLYKLGARQMDSALCLSVLEQGRKEMAQLPGHARRIAAAIEDAAPGSTRPAPTFNVLVTDWKPGSEAAELGEGDFLRLVEETGWKAPVSLAPVLRGAKIVPGENREVIPNGLHDHGYIPQVFKETPHKQNSNEQTPEDDSEENS